MWRHLRFNLVFSLGLLMTITCLVTFSIQNNQSVTIGDNSFRDFIQGEFGNSGANLYLSHAGRLQTINRLDFNNDGEIDLLVNNKHDFNWAPDLFIYWGHPEGFRSLTPPAWQKQPLAHLLNYLEESRHWVTRLPAFGGGRSRVLDLNGDGYLDLVFCNFLHAEKTEMEAYIYWGSVTGYEINRRTTLPTLLASGLEAADLNRDGYIDLVFANFGLELGQVFGYRYNLESYIYWGSSTGYDARRRSTLPTISAVDCAVADINGDGNLDLVFLNNNTEVKNAYVYWGDGKEYSASRRTLLKVEDPKGVTSIDINKDGYSDLAITGGGETSSIFYGSKKGIEEKPRYSLPTNAANATVVTDLNRDGIPDLAFANTKGQTSCVYWGDAAGYSASRRTELPTLQAWGVTAGDLNADNWPDLVFANSSSGNTNDVNSFIYWGSASGFAPFARTELQTLGAVSTQVADLNQDGLKDVVFINQSSGHAEEALDSYLFWGNPQHSYSVANMTRLPTVSADESSAADLNDDGYADLVITNPYQAVPAYLYWGGPQGYSPEHRTEIPIRDAYGSSVADFNRDGHLDLLFSIGPRGDTGMGLAAQGLVKDHGYASILWGGPNGYGLERRQNLAINTRFPFSNTVADLNKDGYLDLLFPDRNSDHIQIVWGSKNGFDVKASTLLPANSTPSLEIADVNADGWLDVICPNGHDMKTMTRHTRSYIYLGGPAGFSATRRIEVESISAHEAAVTDFNLDGYLDIAFTSYQGDANRNVPTFIYWGGPDRTFLDSRRTQLPSHGGCGLVAADLNQDGYPDLFAWNHVKDGDHSFGSWIYWGSKEGFSVKRRTLLPSAGPHYSMGVDIGNLYDRKPEEYYISRPLEVPSGYELRKLTWDSITAPGTQARLQLRTAANRELLSTAVWHGPKGENSFYENEGVPLERSVAGQPWVQYRVVFAGLQVGNSSILKAVNLECHRK